MEDTSVGALHKHLEGIPELSEVFEKEYKKEHKRKSDIVLIALGNDNKFFGYKFGYEDNDDDNAIYSAITHVEREPRYGNLTIVSLGNHITSLKTQLNGLKNKDLIGKWAEKFVKKRS